MSKASTGQAAVHRPRPLTARPRTAHDREPTGKNAVKRKASASIGFTLSAAALLAAASATSLPSIPTTPSPNPASPATTPTRTPRAPTPQRVT